MISPTSSSEQTSSHIGKELQKAEKQHQWDQIVARFQETTDRLGMEIDTGIFETVVALNAVGFITMQSCEGHLDRALAHPWVSITTEGNEEAEAAFDAALAIAEQKEAQLVEQYGDHSEVPNEKWGEVFDEVHRLNDEMLLKPLQDRQKLLELLSEFYMNRKVPFDVQLRILEQGVYSQLESQGSSIQKITPEEIKAQKLAAYQEEMKAFTAFLKKKFFEGLI